MKRIKFLVLLLSVVLLTGCKAETSDETSKAQALKSNEIYAYFVNTEQTDLVPVAYTKKASNDISKEVSKLLAFMEKEGSKEYRSAIPKGITYKGNQYNQSEKQMTLSFDVLYDSVDAQSLLFFKACVVQSVIQLDYIDMVTISLSDVTNNDEETATVVENFDADSFTMSFGDASGYKQKGTIVLYFATEDGEALKEYHKTVEISNNTSLAKLVVESLIAGPEANGYTATLSKDITIRNVSVKDGICYVDLSDEFYDTKNSLKNDIIIYSIVNSLVELPTVSKVQFLKNGEKQQFYRETMPFDGIFERNLDLVKEEDAE